MHRALLSRALPGAWLFQGRLLPRLVAPVLLVPVLLATLMSAGAWAWPRDWEHRIAHEQSFDVASRSKLVVRVPDADVEILAGDGNRVDVRIDVASSDLTRAMELYEDMQFEVDRRGDEIRIDARELRRRNWSWRGPSFAVVVQVRMPRDFDADVETSDGDILVESMNGQLRVHTSDGDIRVDRVEGARVLLDTSDGDILMGDVRAPDIQIESSDGNIEIENLIGRDVDIRTSDGDIAIEAMSGGLNVLSNDGNIHVRIDQLETTTLRTRDGNITVIAATDLSANVDFHGEDVVLRQLDLAFDGDLTQRRVRGKLNGGGPRLQANSRDGRITLSSR